ncbi:MAG TPA: hypothetical protein VLI69_05825 [Gammaproteobacteria bacterium]|nr:hypothetical protein [Gammaproteobacteria bacterium]
MQSHKPDRWTNLAALGTLATDATSNFYWAVTLSNLMKQLIDKNINQPLEENNLPNGSLIAGCLLMLFALGSAYAHRAVNARLQANKKEKKEGLLKSKEHHAASSHLSIWQRISLAADFVTHSGDVSEALIAGSKLMAQYAVKEPLTVLGGIVLEGGGTLLGALCAIAEVRTCKHAMIGEVHVHAEGEEHEHKADALTWIAAGGKLASRSLSTFFWIASLMELLYEPEQDKLSDLSFYLGCGFMLLALGSMYTNKKLNTFYQDPKLAVLPDDLPNRSLTCLQKAALGADMATSIGDIAGSITAGTKLAIQFAGKKVPYSVKLLLQVSGTLFGASASVAGFRSRKKAILAQNKPDIPEEFDVRRKLSIQDKDKDTENEPSGVPYVVAAPGGNRSSR